MAYIPLNKEYLNILITNVPNKQKLSQLLSLLLILLYKSNHYDNSILNKRFNVNQLPGTSIISIAQLQTHLPFGTKLISNLLKKLSVLGIIEILMTKKCTIIKFIDYMGKNGTKQPIINKEEYVDSGITDGEKANQIARQSETQMALTKPLSNNVDKRKLELKMEEQKERAAAILLNKKNKEEKNKKDLLLNKFDFSFIDEQFEECFMSWIDYKTEINDQYKTQKAIELAYKNLLGLSNNDPTLANKIINRSIEKGWKSLYKIKNRNKNENPKRLASSSIAEPSGSKYTKENCTFCD